MTDDVDPPPLTVALLVITDGRDGCLAATMDSVGWNLVSGPGSPIIERFLVDDTGDPIHRADMARLYPAFTLIHGGHRQGFGGAIRTAWEHLTVHSRADFVFHVEGDFLFRRPVEVGLLAAVLTEHPHLAQIALRRQPWSPEEIAAGGVVERHADSYQERSEWVTDGGPYDYPANWLEHRLFFTTNPCLYRASLMQLGWPSGAHSEGRFSLALLRDGIPGQVTGADLRYGYWGTRDSGVWVDHIGHHRTGIGY